MKEAEEFRQCVEELVVRAAEEQDEYGMGDGRKNDRGDQNLPHVRKLVLVTRSRQHLKDMNDGGGKSNERGNEAVGCGGGSDDGEDDDEDVGPKNDGNR